MQAQQYPCVHPCPIADPGEGRIRIPCCSSSISLLFVVSETQVVVSLDCSETS